MDKAYLDTLPPLRDVIRDHSLRAEKALGQNFIMDLNITDKITGAAGDLDGYHVFEIGPGPGGLTRSLLRSDAKKVCAVEFDPRAIGALQDLEEKAGGRLHLIHGDALKADLTELSPSPRKIVANLPYNISTVLLLNWLRQEFYSPGSFDGMTLMFQKEVAERICSPAGVKAYGRLAVMAQWLCHVHIAFDLPPTAFVPPPKVTSSIVQISPRAYDASRPDFKLMEEVTAAAFNQRRKMIRSSLKKYEDALKQINIDETLRAEQLSVDDFINICLHIKQ